jgi:ParB family chromosome partitioning protein
MAFKDTVPNFQMIDVTLIDPDPAHPRRNFDDNALKSLANSIEKKGLIHPVVVLPATGAGRHVLLVGERRWRAAVIAGERTIPALVRPCDSNEALEIRVFENLGLGLRAALEPREMANAIQAIAENFETQEAAADHFGRSANWLTQATAAANLSPKVTALLDSGKIASTSTAVQLEKLAQKNEAKADSLIVQIEQLPEGEKIGRKVVDTALSQEGGRRKKKDEVAPEMPAPTSSDVPPWEELPAPPVQSAAPPRRINSGKVKMVAEILGLSDGDEDAVIAMLIDEFLALKGEGKAGLTSETALS